MTAGGAGGLGGDGGEGGGGVGGGGGGEWCLGCARFLSRGAGGADEGEPLAACGAVVTDASCREADALVVPLVLVVPLLLAAAASTPVDRCTFECRFVGARLIGAT